MFNKMETSKLLSHLSAFKKKSEKEQAVITQLIANVIYQSIAHSNADTGMKLIGAMSANGYNRTNDTISFLCKLGNFKYSKSDGLQFKSNFPRTEEMAVEMAEKAISNPMFTIVREQKVAQDMDLTRALKALVEKAKRTIAEGKAVLVDDDKEAALFAQIEEYVSAKA